MVDQFTKGQLFSGNWQKCELKMPSNPKNSARKRVQEIFAISWNPRKSELVKLQYNPNDHKWGIFGCTKCYCYIDFYSSDEYTGSVVTCSLNQRFVILYSTVFSWHMNCQPWSGNRLLSGWLTFVPLVHQGANFWGVIYVPYGLDLRLNWSE